VVYRLALRSRVRPGLASRFRTARSGDRSGGSALGPPAFSRHSDSRTPLQKGLSRGGIGLVVATPIAHGPPVLTSAYPQSQALAFPFPFRSWS
jgi:hypothetical protein